MSIHAYKNSDDTIRFNIWEKVTYDGTSLGWDIDLWFHPGSLVASIPKHGWAEAKRAVKAAGNAIADGAKLGFDHIYLTTYAEVAADDFRTKADALAYIKATFGSVKRMRLDHGSMLEGWVK